MIGFPPCKINLGLHVIRKRPDGYHDIETCFYPVPFTDILEVLPASSFSFHQSGLAVPGSTADNLCVKAWRLMHEHYGTPEVAVYLHKCIPAGAGLGGGSSDAAWMLRLLQQMFHPSMPRSALMLLAARLGSDCPFFLFDNPMLGTGRGEVLNPVNVSLKGSYLVLLKPDLHISTAEAYARITPSDTRPKLDGLLGQGLPAWRDKLVNDFEVPVMEAYPLLRELKETLYSIGARYASLSGSGSAVFGIFDGPPALPSHLQNVMIWQGSL